MALNKFLVEYMESLPDKALLAICRWGGMSEAEIKKITPRPPGPYERPYGRETGRKRGQPKKNS
jgi:hypothetical protein